jgi:hypothetical protein
MSNMVTKPDHGPRVEPVHGLIRAAEVPSLGGRGVNLVDLEGDVTWLS